MAVLLALLDGEFTIKTYHRKGQQVRLTPANKAFREIVVAEESSFEIWGVITKSIRML
jgi:SOS-response transcriptional repressor LexA